MRPVKPPGRAAGGCAGACAVVVARRAGLEYGIDGDRGRLSPGQSLPGECVVAGSFQEWLQQGEDLYNNALREYHDIEQQLGELEARLVEKQSEVNQIAQVIGKPLVEGGRRLSAQLVNAGVVDMVPAERTAPPGSNANIARALTGKFGR